MSVKMETCIDDIVLTAEKLSTLGIIINEIVSNAVKYAVRGRPDGVIRVAALKKDGRVSLIIHDNGPGIPESISFKSSSGFGLQLVDMLATQLKGSVSIERTDGTKITLSFEE
jgi:two-component sensor histidine kinase